jgi:hypothetical protein
MSKGSFLRDNPITETFLKREVTPDLVGPFGKAEHRSNDLALFPREDEESNEAVHHIKGGELPEDQWMYT